MKRLLLLKCILLFSVIAMANTIVVKNIEELNAANKQAKPGDIVILQNGEWNNVMIALNCSGTKELPISFKAQSPGKVLITGHSQLKLGGNYIVVDGLYFTRGYGGGAVVDFRINKNQLANHCRLTNCVINDFNNPKRVDENYWISLSGQYNRVDHCNFLNKKNLGVLMAVILDDDRSRENFHSVDHNYFGARPPLASNGGEIIRIGVSEHSQFNSNTQVTDNFFEYCDGETEIISVKSAGNVVRNNLFKECQGGVVLRHGNYNTVENNIFFGNDKEGTGGVRIINKGQWVINNLFYKCRGVDFRSPLSVMNGIPNSPAYRYVQVTDAVVANNTFFNCSSISFCEGSDTERTLTPQNVYLLNNSFYNTRDSIIYKRYDDINGFTFSNNLVSKDVKQATTNGFERTSFTVQKADIIALPYPQATGAIPDSLQKIAQQRLQHSLSSKTGFADLPLLKKIMTNAYSACGATWFKRSNSVNQSKSLVVNCKTAEEIYTQLERKEPVTIKLTGNKYILNKPFIISKNVQFTGDKKNPLGFYSENIPGIFVIAGNGNLSLENLTINGTAVKAMNFISNDTSGSSNHYNLAIRHCILEHFSRENGCKNLFYAYKSMVADSIVLLNNSFLNNNSNGVEMSDEKDNKGYYNAEKITINQNSFNKQNGSLLNIYRGGNDESTMGPLLSFRNNKLTDCKTEESKPFISLYGVQRSFLEKNEFNNCNEGGTLIDFKDAVRAAHVFRNNRLTGSGKINVNKFVRSENNMIR
jgi:poly(beta-D-mannuronate) lyase